MGIISKPYSLFLRERPWFLRHLSIRSNHRKGSISSSISPILGVFSKLTNRFSPNSFGQRIKLKFQILEVKK